METCRSVITKKYIKKLFVAVLTIAQAAAALAFLLGGGWPWLVVWIVLVVIAAEMWGRLLMPE